MKSFSFVLATFALITSTAFSASDITRCYFAINDIILVVQQDPDYEYTAVYSTNLSDWVAIPIKWDALNDINDMGSGEFEYEINEQFLENVERLFFSFEKTLLPELPEICSLENDLTVGSSGADVIVLQQWLIDGGYLVIPAGVSMGYFGSLTRDALAMYQMDAGVSPAVGYFGPITRASLPCSQETAEEPDVDLVSVTSVNLTDRGVYTIEFEVENDTDEDIYIHKDADRHDSVFFKNGSEDGSIIGTAYLFNSSDSDSGDEDDWFIVDEGDSRVFTFTAILNPDVAGTYAFQLTGLRWMVEMDTIHLGMIETGPGFKTDSEVLSKTTKTDYYSDYESGWSAGSYSYEFEVDDDSIHLYEISYDDYIYDPGYLFTDYEYSDMLITTPVDYGWETHSDDYVYGY